MKYSGFIGVLGLLACPLGFAMGAEDNKGGWTTTATWNGKVTTITVADYTYTSPHPVPTTTTKPDVEITTTYDDQTVTESGTIKTVPGETITITIADGTKLPPRAVETQHVDARDRTSVSMWTETTTYTVVVPATTLTGSTTTATFSDYYQTVTWTKVVTSHVTIPDAAYPTLPIAQRKSTLETVVLADATSSSSHQPKVYPSITYTDNGFNSPAPKVVTITESQTYESPAIQTDIMHRPTNLV